MTAVSSLLISACTGGTPPPPVGPTALDTDNDGIADRADRCPTQPETPNGVFDRDGCPDSPRDLYVAVQNDVESFWNLYFGTVIFRPYFRAGLQFFAGTVFSPCVSGSGIGPFYCGIDTTVYLDEPFMNSQLSRIGDFAPAVIIAHEVGHHTQNLLGLFQISIVKELQADCLAGAWAASAGARGLLDASDFQEGARSLFEVGDPAGTPWFAPGAHGSPAARVQSFQNGFLRGALSCG